MSKVAIAVENVSKLYKLYDKPSDRLKESLGLTKQKCYREHFALQDISFQVNRGETVGIIGTNGSGKSTILKIITGVLNPSAGEVQVNGRISALLELGAGFNMEYTGIENIYLNGTMIGFEKEEIDEKLEAILSFADIGDFVYQPVKTYSSGMFVRLAFAVAINIEPEILIVDEALSVGDVFFQAKCYRKFEEFKKLGKTILFVSHDLGSIHKYCDRAILLNKGTKITEDETKVTIDMYKKLLVNQLDTPTEENEDLTTLELKPGKVMKKQEEWKKRLQLNPDIVEYGDKKAEIVDFAIIDEYGYVTNSIDKGTDFLIKMRIKFNQSIEEPIGAFTIKDLRGTEVTGTNTMFEGADIGTKQSGDEITVTFSQEMVLQGGEYMLSLGCTGYHQGEFTVFHRQYDICNITVVSSRNTVGYFDIKSSVKLD
jgi:ABC-type polysaccharide/polyol phosphate transport system, ATPase component